MAWRGRFFAPGFLLFLGASKELCALGVCSPPTIIFNPKFNMKRAEMHLHSAAFLKVAILLPSINNYLVTF
jgi:hypothetical protein